MSYLDIPTRTSTTSSMYADINQLMENIDILRNPGAVTAWLTETPPTGWLECDGSAVSRTTYADLFAVIGVTFGNGDGSTTFNVPDLRGEFLRGWDNSAGTDPDAASRTNRGDSTTGDHVGTKQADVYGEHYHAFRWHDDGAYDSSVCYGDSDNHDYDGNPGSFEKTVTSSAYGPVAPSGDDETRPTNVAVMYAIKY